MIDIQRQTRKAKSIPLVSLIDVVFQLLIYFMLTTSFTKTESLELLLPPSAPPTAHNIRKDAEETLHIYISDVGETFLENKSINEQDMVRDLHGIFTQTPDRGVLVLSASKVPVQVLVRVMDRIYTAGGRNIAVADWILPPSVTVPPKPPEQKAANG
ncbi:MAG TPA: biopolymer transporter ExbD [Rickettsiales bacterium]|nr:biopolymer transporter ExbD [Rickettsiales bacterium]